MNMIKTGNFKGTSKKAINKLITKTSQVSNKTVQVKIHTDLRYIFLWYCLASNRIITLIATNEQETIGPDVGMV